MSTDAKFSDCEEGWVAPEVSYVAPQRRFCTLCGRPIARRYWQVAKGGTRRIFCDPAHAAMYTTYPKRLTTKDAL